MSTGSERHFCPAHRRHGAKQWRGNSKTVAPADAGERKGKVAVAYLAGRAIAEKPKPSGESGRLIAPGIGITDESAVAARRDGGLEF